MSSYDPNQVAYIRGDKLFKQGRFGPAAKWFAVAIEEWSEDWQALWALGNCYSELKKPKKAESCFREALSWAPEKDQPPIIYNLANALFDQQKFQDAIATYQKLPSGHPLGRQARNNIALAQARLTNET